MSPSLTQLLTAARQPSSSPPGEFPISAVTPKPSTYNGAAAVGSGDNVLALLRSGTAGQAVTFVVFRDEPIAGWAAPAGAVQLDLDPDRLAPSENVTGIVDVFLGVDCRESLAVKKHPLTKILRATAHKLIVLEAQLPVPVPVAGNTGRHWARVRVALRDEEDLRRLPEFLDSCIKVAGDGYERPVVAVQVVPSGGPRVITEPVTEPGISAREGLPVLASDMDVVNAAANEAESADAPIWRVLAICADASSNIETDIVKGLGDVRPQLRLVGLTYALLRGKAIMLLLGHEPVYTGRDSDLETEFRGNRMLANLRVLVDEWRSRNELGRAKLYPLLRVLFRSQDRPGALLNVLGSLNEVFRDGSLSPSQ